MITGDESKRQENLRKHEMDFVGCEAVFDHPVATQEDSRDAYGKQRINLIGWLRGQWVHLTYTKSMFLLFFLQRFPPSRASTALAIQRPANPKPLSGLASKPAVEL